MNRPRITLLGSLEQPLREWLNGEPDGHERGAIVLFRNLDRPIQGLPASPRFVGVEWLKLEGDWILDSSPAHLKINLRKLPEVYLRCEQEGLELGFVHSHPTGCPEFSQKDDLNEQAILRGYSGCNGPGATLVSLVLCDNQWRGRVRNAANPATTKAARHVSVLSDTLDVHLDTPTDGEDETLKRQAAAFGKPFNRKLQSLRAVLVGAGGTGSPLATLLARAGIGELVIIDGDDLEETNLNRVRGYRRTDVGQKKADVLTTYIKNLGLPCRVTGIPEYLHQSATAVDALATADVVFGCTDDVGGRDVLTQAMYYYSFAYIDIGLTGRICEDGGGAYLRDHRGRISVMLPEFGACLRCQRVVTEEKLKFERAVKERPELKKLDPDTLRREFYLTGGHESAPGVGPFTSATADLAVASFMDLIRRYRRLPSDLRQDNIWVDFVHLNFHSNEPEINPECFCCGARGLRNVAEGQYRLDMPALGKKPIR